MKFSLSNDDIDACGFFGCENSTAWLPLRFLKSRRRDAIEILNEDAGDMSDLKKRSEALEILKADDWREFKVGYHHSFHKVNGWTGMREGEKQTEFDVNSVCSSIFTHSIIINFMKAVICDRD